MRQKSTRRRHAREIAPVVRTTFDGRPLLPGEVPIVGIEQALPAAGDPLQVALAMFDDMLSRPAPRVATPIDRWGMIRDGDSGPVLLEAAVEEALKAEPPLQECGPTIDIDFSEWGDSADVIEEWFRTGEFMLPDETEDEPPVTWFGALVRRVRQVWSGEQEPDAAWEQP